MMLTVLPAAVSAMYRSASVPAASPYSMRLIGSASTASPADAAKPINQNQRSARLACCLTASGPPRSLASAIAGIKSTDSDIANIVTI
ncbi:hypothetical protein D3C73_1496110 [compost metagenome]